MTTDRNIETLSRLHIPLLMTLRGFISLREVGPKALTSQQVMVLLLLSKHPDISLSQLAQRAKVTHGTMVIAVQKLTAKGLVRRKAHPTDRRSVVLNLTSKGAAIPTVIHEEIHRRYQSLCESLPETKVAKLLQSIELLMEVLS